MTRSLDPDPGTAQPRGPMEAPISGDAVAALAAAEDVRLLVELGFMALSAGLAADARAIFAGVAALRPRQEAGPLGLALCLLAEGEVDAAVATLRALPPGDAAQTWLGMALARQGNAAEAAEILGRVVADAPATPFADLAAALLKGDGA